MKRAFFLFLLLLAACGGPATPGTRPEGPGTLPAALADVTATAAATATAGGVATVPATRSLPTAIPGTAEALPTDARPTAAPTAVGAQPTPVPSLLPATPTADRPVLPTPPPAGIEAELTYLVVARYPHDPEAFTQGLVYVDGTLYEGTGINGRSSLRRVDLLSGSVLQRTALDNAFFGEGIAVWEDRIIQLTWQSNTALVYDRGSFALLGQFSYPTEGWGLTHDGVRLLMSDGSSRITFRDPTTFAELGTLDVVDEQGAVVRLNELEYIEGSLFANVWQTDTIVRIDPQTGRVTGRIDLSGLLTPAERSAADVLNGIAWDAAAGRLFVTGKWWPWLFEIVLVPADG